MVHKLSPHMKPSIKRPCKQTSSIKRPICIGASVEQRPWKPTICKATITNKLLPGKPAYQMTPTYLGPNVVDSKKKSSPAYSIGIKLTKKQHHIEDGPAKVNIRGLNNRGVQTAPAFSLKWRQPGVIKFQSPSANKYFIENSLKATSTTIPKFSFGKRPIIAKTLPTPAPNVYNLPQIFGTSKEGKIKSGPAFTMLGRAKTRRLFSLNFPGPGDYEANYRYVQKHSPRYTLHTRHKVVSEEHLKPGPAAHCPEKYIRHKSVPAPSFGIKHTPFLGQRKAYLAPEHKCSTEPKWAL